MKNKEQIDNKINELKDDIPKLEKDYDYWKDIRDNTDSIKEKKEAKSKMESADRMINNNFAMTSILHWVKQ
ncbi:hypothetical protein MBBAR_10c00640 [Methanobrevibacter arboriphilus JCM 13429 = DSM 1125]|uniref:Uncharacterized protein n=1 Tax=Methanobrevibacter arboriphilus JCM 13429 = DSM 1125 TaxID=1300164 RepID=A0A1V6N2D4_METAZ|nr:hypothetical protein [Methanobrevibacter arboriphilus]OQD58723.1 hypothetical protein MBBAR_10c00640 [Methanobrevibacter arboriphilus JCM 13429 = DSM 1125]